MYYEVKKTHIFYIKQVYPTEKINYMFSECVPIKNLSLLLLVLFMLLNFNLGILEG